MTRAIRERGLAAVARVRGVQERASQVRLQQALAEQRSREEVLRDLERQLEAADLGLGMRMTLVHLSQVVIEARTAIAEAERTTASARARWEDDKTRLTVVERLVEQRLLAHRAALARTQAHESDELAATGWIRRRTDDQGGAA